jgi:hypothetical protein
MRPSAIETAVHHDHHRVVVDSCRQPASKRFASLKSSHECVMSKNVNERVPKPSFLPSDGLASNRMAPMHP